MFWQTFFAGVFFVFFRSFSYSFSQSDGMMKDKNLLERFSLFFIYLLFISWRAAIRVLFSISPCLRRLHFLLLRRRRWKKNIFFLFTLHALLFFPSGPIGNSTWQIRINYSIIIIIIIINIIAIQIAHFSLVPCSFFSVNDCLERFIRSSVWFGLCL